jgi:hypothetical protein
VKGEVGLFKKGDELVVEIGTLRRHIGLPASMAALSPARAKLDNKVLTVEMRETATCRGTRPRARTSRWSRAAPCAAGRGEAVNRMFEQRLFDLAGIPRKITGPLTAEGSPAMWT